MLEKRRYRHIKFGEFHFGVIVVDPPRKGLDAQTVRLVARYPHILYISCNPEALLGNLASLSTTHQVVRFAVFDHFPYTTHVECGVWLQLKNTV